MTVFSKKEKLTILGVLVALFAVFTFTDLQISQAIFNIESLFGRFFEAFGETPASFISLFSSVILFRYRDKNNKIKNIASIIGFGLLIVLSTLMGGVMSAHYLFEDTTMMMAVGAVIGIAMLALSIYLSGLIDADHVQMAKKVAIVGVLLFFIAAIGINIIKPLAGRMRFRNMVGSYEGFTAWYVFGAEKVTNILGPSASEAYKSFPSGHTANSAVILWVTLLPLMFAKLDTTETRRNLKIFAFVWIILVAVSRIVMGAHFATDVTFGGAFTIIAFLILESIFFKEK